MGDPARIYFRDAGYDGQLARTLALASDRCADLGEAFAAARAVGSCTPENWHTAWSAAAGRAEAMAGAAGAAGDRVSACYAHLRASEYHRQSFFFLRGDLDDQRLHDGYAAQVAAFRQGIALLDHSAAPVEIPYQGTHLNGYLHSAGPSGTQRPTIVIPAGYDSTAESLFGVTDAVERGFNVLTYEGPGQGGALYRQRLYFSPDTEQVISPVVNWLLTMPEVDPKRIVLIGRSFGGYIVARAAAFEHRIAAMVLDPAQPRLADRLPGGIAGSVAPHVVNAQMRFSPNRAEFFNSRMATHGLHTVADYFAELRRYDMVAVASQIQCPTLIIEAENDFAGGSSGVLRDAMTAPVDVIGLTAAQGADGHCAGLGQWVWAGTVYPWLLTTLAAPQRV